MPSFSYFSGVVTSNHSLSTTGESGYIGRDATVDGQILGFASSLYIHVDGLAIGGTSAVSLATSGNNNLISIGATGRVVSLTFGDYSGVAVEMDVAAAPGVAAVGRLMNAGEISGRSIGFFAYTAAAIDTVEIRNSGTIFGGASAIHTQGSGSVSIINSGVINGGLAGITYQTALYFAPAVGVSLINTGTVAGSSFSVQTGAAADTIINRGSLMGNLSTGAGNDSVDMRGGTIIGTVSLGDGNDVIIGNNTQAEVFDGGAGLQDMLDFRFGAGAHVALDGSFGNDGAALGDLYTGFEIINGSNAGNDRLRGGAEVNSFLGNGGNDFLDGGAGNDALRGGTGTDTLMGGAGNDLFRFFFLNECGDVIVDFSSNAPGNNDAIQISAAGFGGGLVAGVLAESQFQNRADNLAQDADDRFIFRTTDKTLWYDADGNGAGAAILVASFQAWATMTAADILIL